MSHAAKTHLELRRSSGGFLLTLVMGALALGCFWLLKNPEWMRLDTLAWVQAKTPVRLRHAGEHSWKQQTLNPVFQGTLIEVPLQATARLILKNGKSEWLQGGTVVRVLEISEGTPQIQVLLRKNSVSGLVEYRQSTDLGGTLGEDVSEAHLLEPIADVEQETRRVAELSRRAERAFRDILYLDYTQANVGFPSLHVFGAFDDYAVVSVDPPVGTLFKAENNEKPCINFSWTTVPTSGVDYVLEIAKTHDFNFFRSFGSIKNSVSVRLDQASDYYWRVRALHRGQALLSSPTRFTLYKPPLPPEVVKRQQIVKRIRDVNASLMDLEYCQ